MQARQCLLFRQLGFSLFELILTLVVLSILSIGLSGFVGSSVEGYIDSRDRESLQSQARFVVERIGREVRHGVPSSVAITDEKYAQIAQDSGACLIYTPIKYAGFYKQLVNNINTVEVALSTESFNWQAGDANSRVVFTPMKRADLFNKTGAAELNNSFDILSATENQLTLSNPSGIWPQASFSRRFYIYKHSVAFCFKGGKVTRRVIFADGSLKKEEILAENVLSGSQFTLVAPSLSQANLINVYYRFGKGDETSIYNQQIQVSNVP